MIDRYALLGDPVAHSQSPRIHAMLAKKYNQDISYELICIAKNNFKQELKNLVADGYKGFNITLPFKQQAFECATELSNAAKLIGAVNTLSVLGNNQIYGENTDAIGFLKDIERILNNDLNNKNILILGAGGCARAVAYAGSLNRNRLFIFNRSVNKAEQLITDFKANKINISLYSNEKIDVIVNATSASLNKQLPVMPSINLSENSMVYDCFYSSTATPFMQWAAIQKIKIIAEGSGMLYQQAKASFLLWRPHSILPAHKISRNSRQ